jgi:hypothetical protein
VGAVHDSEASKLSRALAHLQRCECRALRSERPPRRPPSPV